MSEELFTDHIAAAERHVRLATEYLGHRPATSYEFGAGWDLVVPLVLARDGLRDQTLTDVRRLVRQELVADSAAGSASNRTWVRSESPISPPWMPWRQASFGLVRPGYVDRYARACSSPATRPFVVGVPTAAATGWGSHCPDRLSGSLRIRRPLDRPVPFPSVRRAELATVKSPSHFQSRLRHVDHVRAIEGAGLEVLAVDHPAPLTDALGAIHREFGRYERMSWPSPRHGSSLGPDPASSVRAPALSRRARSTLGRLPY